MNPIVSVVLPVFNGAELVADAVASVREQDFALMEILVVDDGSTDETARVVRGLGPDIRYLNQQRGGPAAARNRGVAAAQGVLIAFIDQDDLWPPNHLQILMGALEAEPSAMVAMGLTQARVLVERSADGPAFAEHGRPWRAPHLGSALFEKAVFDSIGPFNDRLRYCSDDLDWFLRAREYGLHIAETDAVTYWFRIHEGNTSRDAGFRREALLEAVHASVRRRQGNGRG